MSFHVASCCFKSDLSHDALVYFHQAEIVEHPDRNGIENVGGRLWMPLQLFSL